MERDNNEKIMQKQILRAREHSRNDLLQREKHQMPEQKITFNITYHPAYQNVRSVMEELHFWLIPNKEHKKIFSNETLKGFWNGKSLKDHLIQCMKSVRIRSFSGTYFPAFGLNTERYFVSFRIQSKCGKIRTRKTPNTDFFHAMIRATLPKRNESGTMWGKNLFGL